MDIFEKTTGLLVMDTIAELQTMSNPMEDYDREKWKGIYLIL